MFVAAHKKRWFCILTFLCDVIFCCCSQSVLVLCLTLLCDDIVLCCAQSVMVLCFDLIL